MSTLHHKSEQELRALSCGLRLNHVIFEGRDARLHLEQSTCIIRAEEEKESQNVVHFVNSAP